MNAEYYWCVNAGSTTVPYAVLWCGMVILSEVDMCEARGIWEIALYFAQYCHELKTDLK